MAYQILDEEGQSLDSHFDLNENQIIVHSRGVAIHHNRRFVGYDIQTYT